MFRRSFLSAHKQLQSSRLPRPQHVASLYNIPSFASTRNPVLNKPPQPQQRPDVQPASSSSIPRRVFKYSLAVLVLLAASVTSAYELTHLYTENVAMSPESDDEVKKWGWDFATYWSGDISRGGTDPLLDYRARHLIHAAWGSSEWDLGPNANLQSSAPSDKSQHPRFKILDSRLLATEKYTRAAVELIEAEGSASNLHPGTLSQLRLQHALVLEQMEPQYWNEAKSELHEIWKDISDPSHRAFVAWKLGDINERLGFYNEAQDWWNKATNIAQERQPDDSPLPRLSVPQSPLLQRVLFSTLVSKSAFLARHNRLKEAQNLEESALDLLRSIHQPDSLASATPPQALHATYLLQRSALFSIHLAEVLYAQKRKWKMSAQYLELAAESSARVARMLTAAQAGQGIETSTGCSGNLDAAYSSSRSMNRPAHILLRDARRTAAEAWNLLGVLYENHEGRKSQKALECFEQALTWAGSQGADGRQEASDSTLESDWRIYKANSERLKSQLSSKSS